VTTTMLPPRPIDELLRALDDLGRHRVLVVGDLFLDEYVEGEMVGISKEGPIPIVRFRSRTTAAGAAGNLASSIRNLGAQVSIVSVAGRDTAGDLLLAELVAKGIDISGVIVDAQRPTLQYGKIRAGVDNAPSREILRLDVLPDGPVRAEIEFELLARIKARLGEVDAVIVLDQIHYTITPAMLERLPELARSAGVFLQGSSRERLAEFREFDLVIPNEAEARAALGAASTGEIDRVGREVAQRGRHRELLLTLGPDGMACFPDPRRDEAPVRIPTFAREIADVTGAGDAVASAVILGRLAGWDLTTAAWCASHCAAIAVAHVGTHHVNRGELERALRDTR